MLLNNVRQGRAISDIAATTAAKKQAVKSSLKSGVIFAKGHEAGVDPGAVYRKTSKQGQQVLVTETDIIASIIKVLAETFSKQNVNMVVSLWQSLTALITFFRNLFSSRNQDDLLVQIHADYAIPNVDKRPNTIGFYYASQNGKKAADRIIGMIKEIDSSIYCWNRHHTASPRGSLAFVKRTKHVALIAEVDFINRNATDRNKVNEVFASAMLKYSQKYGQVESSNS